MSSVELPGSHTPRPAAVIGIPTPAMSFPVGARLRLWLRP